ncbi:unnamed protein product [Lymnaea stagnalis]|uniref:Mannosyltransferase n=1 Tax=Lymnaea stagnalis TaxID=6523 RepID=A0AAV2I7V9_LYMST
MTKDSKTVSTIRRRKGKQVALALQKIKDENPKKSIKTEEQVAAIEIEEKCYLFDNRVFGPTILRQLMYNTHSLYLALLAIRSANALLIQTQYVPDEYWQSVEVAHKMVFGYGYLTWEWREGLRGYSYPLIFAFFFKILEFLGLDSRMMLIKLPRLIQGAIAAYGDLQLYKLSSKLSGRATAQWSLLCQLFSWFTIYCCTRTLTNSTEATLVIASLSYFPWPDYPSKSNDVYKFLALAALSVIVRPTSALVWIFLCAWHLQRVRGSPVFSGVLSAYVTVGILALGSSAVIDRIWYGYWTFVQLNFLLFNVIKGGASIYGVHPWHWYFFQGFPVILGTFILPFIVGVWRAKNKALAWIIFWILATHSFLPHKEFRFILLALPMAMHYCGVYFQTLCTQPPLKKFIRLAKEKRKKASEAKVDKVAAGCEEKTDSGQAPAEVGNDNVSDDQGDDKKTKGNEVDKTVDSSGDAVRDDMPKAEKQKSEKEGEDLLKEDELSDTLDPLIPEKKLLHLDTGAKSVEEFNAHVLRDEHHRYNLAKAKFLILLLALTNLLPALYFCLLHQRGTVMVTKYLYDASVKNLNMNVLFLMPCHSTPYYSYIHLNVTMRFLTCEPNLLGHTNYTEEADQFYQDPKAWLLKEYSSSKRVWPTHLVYFNTLHNEILSVLTQGGYKLCEQFFHTHVPEGRVGESVFVSCR